MDTIALTARFPSWHSPDGRILLLNADCREVLPLIENGSIDLVLTDPPYGIGYFRHGRGKKRLRGWDKRSVRMAGDTSEIALPPLLLTLARHHIIWGAQHFLHQLPSHGRWLIWDKQTPCGLTSYSEADLAWYSVPGPLKIFRHQWNGFLRASEYKQGRLHTTQKPIALMSWCLSFLPRAEIVLDPYMGSSPVGVACIQTGRGYVGIEIDPAYFQVAVNRCEAALRQPDCFVPPRPHAQQPQLWSTEASHA
jgi:DNA modification methylase